MFTHNSIFPSGNRTNNVGFFLRLYFKVVAVLLLIQMASSAQRMKLYYSAGSAPCRSILLFLKTLKVYDDVDLVPLDLSKKEHLTPEFLKLNPQHCIPTLVDGGFVLWESRAILIYLYEKMGKHESLYPKESKLRACIHHRLFFDIATLYQRFADAYYPLVFYQRPLEDAKVKKLEEAFEFLNAFFSTNKTDYVCGEDLTIADYSIVAGVSTIEAVGFAVTKYPQVNTWLQKCKVKMPGYNEVNEPGCASYRQRYHNACQALNITTTTQKQ